MRLQMHTARLGSMYMGPFSKQLAIGAHAEEEKQSVLAGDPRRGGKEPQCAIYFNRAGWQNVSF